MEIISIFRYYNNIAAPWPATQCSIQARYLLPQQRIAQTGIIEHSVMEVKEFFLQTNDTAP